MANNKPRSQYTLEVLTRDIRNGEPCKSSKCPVALALLRKFKGATWVSVGNTEAYVRFTDEATGRTLRSIDFTLDTNLKSVVTNFDSSYHRSEVKRTKGILAVTRDDSY
jgi:hypothetical protein